MHLPDHPFVHLGVLVLVLIGFSVLSLFILGFVAFRQSRRIHYVSEWYYRRRNGIQGNTFQGFADWADINEATDRSPDPTEGDRER